MLNREVEVLRMIMGAQHSSSALFRAMSMILRGLPFVKVYCDDLLIYTTTREEHIKALGIIFARIAKFGVKLAAAKCNLLKMKLPMISRASAPMARRSGNRLIAMATATAPTNNAEPNQNMPLSAAIDCPCKVILAPSSVSFSMCCYLLRNVRIFSIKKLPISS